MLQRREKRKNRTLLQTVRGANFYVSLTIKLSPAAAEKDFRNAEMHFLRTGIGSGATGILGVFPTCTYRRRSMYISEPRNLLIVNTAKEGIRTRCISPSFLYAKIIHFRPVCKRALTLLHIPKTDI